MSEKVHVQANFVPEKSVFRVVVGNKETGEKVTLDVDELQFGRMVEYFDMVWSSYVKHKGKGKS